MTYCFRIYTENTNIRLIVDAAKLAFPTGFTILKGRGYWNSAEESCLVIEILHTCNVLATVQKLATDIKRINKQDAVYITVTNLSHAEFV